MPVQPPGFKRSGKTLSAPDDGGCHVADGSSTTRYTTLLIMAVIANSTGTTSLAVQGSFDGVSLDSTMAYADTGLPVSASNTPAGLAVVVKHTFIRFVVTQTTATATTSTFYVQSRA